MGSDGMDSDGVVVTTHLNISDGKNYKRPRCAFHSLIHLDDPFHST